MPEPRTGTRIGPYALESFLGSGGFKSVWKAYGANAVVRRPVALGIVHRDLKPENMLLHNGAPNTADFGLARLALDSAQTQRQSGTFVCLSPEAFGGEISPRVDLWAVGVMLHELFSGRNPFLRKTLPEPRHPAPVSGLQTLTSSDLAVIVGKAFELGRLTGFHSAAAIKVLPRAPRQDRALRRRGLLGGVLRWSSRQCRSRGQTPC